LLGIDGLLGIMYPDAGAIMEPLGAAMFGAEKLL
jgi:hypothetical protein